MADKTLGIIPEEQEKDTCESKKVSRRPSPLMIPVTQSTTTRSTIPWARI